MSDWRMRGACVGEDPELFFTIGRAEPAQRQIEEAKQICRRCEVIEACLGWALDARQDAGVWGGLSDDERLSMIRRASRPKTRSA